MPSIRRRLLSGMLAGIALLLIAAVAAVYLELAGEVDELYDAQLQQAAYAFPQVPLPPIPQGSGREQDDNDSPMHDLVLEVHGAGSAQPIYLSHARARLPADAAPGWSTVRIGGEPWRLFVAEFGDRRVAVAQPLAVRREAALEIATRLLLPLAAALPLAGLFIWIGVGRGLRPLIRFSSELHARSPQALTSLPVADLPDELRPMADALNALLQRLQQALEVQRRFIADAAHELLTPLTALRLQSQLLDRAADPQAREAAQAELREGIGRASHVARQLLTLARQAPEAAARPLQPLSLVRLAREAGARYRPAAEIRGQGLEVESVEDPWVQGDETALRTLLDNLLDNAGKYTSAGGRIRLRVASDAGRALLAVDDSGPGIAADERARVFQRFYRIPGGSAQGSGLGLAIVREIAQRHGARVDLESPGALGGLTVNVRLPLAQ